MGLDGTPAADSTRNVTIYLKPEPTTALERFQAHNRWRRDRKSWSSLAYASRRIWLFSDEESFSHAKLHARDSVAGLTCELVVAVLFAPMAAPIVLASRLADWLTAVWYGE